MKILLIVHQYPPLNVGGTELYTQALALALTRHGHQVVVFHRSSASGMGLEQREEDGVQIWWTWSGELSPSRRFWATFRDPLTSRAFAHVLDEIRPDWIHVQHLLGLPLTMLRSIREHGVPFAITLHDYWWVCANAQLVTNYNGRPCAGPRAYMNCARCALARAEGANLWLALPALAMLMAWRGCKLRSALLQANRLIAPSRFVREWYYSHGVPVNRIEVLPHGLEWPADLSRKPATDGIVRLAYIGGLAWQKGVHILVEAFGKVKGAAELWIAGDESFNPTYVAQLRARSSPNVRFLGLLSRTQVWDVLSQVDAAVVPSLWYETFSLIAHEAFAAGAPVVASHLGALSEAVRDGEDGLLVPPGDIEAWRVALQRLVDEPGLIARLRTNVRPPMTLEEHVSQLTRLLGI